jgi:geranylgeranyl diphosphate synthase type 3
MFLIIPFLFFLDPYPLLLLFLNSPKLLRMDDVEDSSDLRRGIPVAHKIYGVPQTINSANYVYFLAMQELYRFRAGRVGKANAGSSLNGKAEEVGNGEKGKGKERQRTEEMTEEDQEKELDEVITGAFPHISIHLKPGCE